MKFTHKGEIFLSVNLIAGSDTDMLIGFEVRDTGIGIPKEKIPNLFDAFSQVDSSTTRKYGGSGLGLAICKRLVTLMGGQISVQSEQSKGAVINFTVRCSKAVLPGLATMKPDRALMKNKTILVVDDNLTNRRILQLQLEALQILPLIASGGQEALQLLETEVSVDLVITDMQMPEMDGLMLARNIKQKWPALPVILLSSIGDECRKNHPGLFMAMLTKPVKPQNLELAIMSHFIPKNDLDDKDKSVVPLLSAEFAAAKPLRILVAEDNLINQKMILRVLEKLGYQATLANTGREVVQLLDNAFYDLILMDVQMPEMDGLEATRYIRENYSRQPVIIALTANAMLEDREECLKAGMNSYLPKPIKLDLLMKLLLDTDFPADPSESKKEKAGQ